MKIYKYQCKVYSSCERLIKVDRRHECGGLYWKGSVETVHGLVDVESHLVPFWKGKRIKLTTMNMVIGGVSYHISIQHYKSYTCKGLSRMAGKFAKESKALWNTT